MLGRVPASTHKLTPMLTNTTSGVGGAAYVMNAWETTPFPEPGLLTLKDINPPHNAKRNLPG